jgi:hypothetical protein
MATGAYNQSPVTEDTRQQTEQEVNAAVNSVVENFSKLPASQTAPAKQNVSTPTRMFGSDKSVHDMLGGGKRKSTPPESVFHVRTIRLFA